MRNSIRLVASIIALLAVLIPLPVMATASAATFGPAPSVPAAARTVDAIPAGLVAAIANAQARDSGHDPAYAIGPNGCAVLPAGRTGAGLRGCFGRTGVAFRGAGTRVNLRLVAWGRSGDLVPVALQRGRQQANRVSYRGAGPQ